MDTANSEIILNPLEVPRYVSLNKTLTIGFVQINNSFSGASYLPYSIGLLQSYIKKYAKHPELFKFLEPVYCRIDVDQAVQRFKTADIVGFSVYVWNFQLSLEIAKQLKKVNKDIKIIFGGPHVPDKAEEFLRKNKFIDIAVHGEGEAVYLALLENFEKRYWQNIPSLSYLYDDVFRSTPKAYRLKDIEVIPSPYLDGTFNDIIKKNPGKSWLALWETNRGCPFKCTFCDWGSATAAKVTKFDMSRIEKEVKWFAQNKIEFIFCCDANFGMLKRDYEIVEIVAESKKKTGYPHALSVQSTKNGLEKNYKILKFLSDNGLNKGVSLSMQSLDVHTLEAIKRDNISNDVYHELQKRFTKDGIETYSDLIIALPNETYNSFSEGIFQLIENGQHNRIQFGNLSILPNAEMGDVEYQKKYKMEIVKTKIINIHGEKLKSGDDVAEYQELVVSTSTMSRNDWIKTRAFAWWIAFLHFNKIFQIPILFLRHYFRFSYKEIFTSFSNPDKKFCTIVNCNTFFENQASFIQKGGEEYKYSKEYLGIYWPQDEYLFIELVLNKKINKFYEECFVLFRQKLEKKGFSKEDINIFKESIKLNSSLIKKPFVKKDLEISLSSDLYPFVKSILVGENKTLEKKKVKYSINRSEKSYDNLDDWLKEVVWYGNKKGAYLYGNISSSKEYDGHF
tara:strand:- start:12959 stop:14992 length:2034 start_codon:yes stop_codon:yes gene_type:complete